MTATLPTRTGTIDPTARLDAALLTKDQVHAIAIAAEQRRLDDKQRQVQHAHVEAPSWANYRCHGWVSAAGGDVRTWTLDASDPVVGYDGIGSAAVLIVGDTEGRWREHASGPADGGQRPALTPTAALQLGRTPIRAVGRAQELEEDADGLSGTHNTS